MKHELPALGYAYNALEPFIDEKTMTIHHTKHHQTYVDKLNAALEKHAEWQGHKTEALLKELNSVPEDIRTAVRNHGGGHYNHSMFWKLLKKDVKMPHDIKAAIEKDFGSFDNFKKAFSDSANSLFGSGWTWLVLDKDKLEIVNAANQDNPLSQGKIPILGIDLWEHSWYILRQNRKAEWVEAFYEVINWYFVNELYKSALHGKSFSI